MFIIFRNIHAHFVISIIIYTLKPLVSFSWMIHPPIYASVKASKLRQGTYRFQRNISPRQNPEIDEWCENSKLRQSLATLTQKNRWDPFTASKAWDTPSHWSWSWQSRVGSRRMLDALNLPNIQLRQLWVSETVSESHLDLPLSLDLPGFCRRPTT
jgi:hypothetical protein